LEDKNEDEGSEKDVPTEHNTQGSGLKISATNQKISGASVINPSSPGDSFAASSTLHKGIDLNSLKNGLS
jgi:hypothetical protein